MIKITNNSTNILYFNLNASTVSEVYNLKLTNNNTQTVTDVELNNISNYDEYQKFTLDMGITVSNADFVNNLDGGYYDYELYQVFDANNQNKLEVGIAHIIEPEPTKYDYDYASASVTKIIYKP